MVMTCMDKPAKIRIMQALQRMRWVVLRGVELIATERATVEHLVLSHHCFRCTFCYICINGL
jgi:hypothetical protein